MARYFHLTANIPNSSQVILCPCLMEHQQITHNLNFLHNNLMATLTLSHTQHQIKYLTVSLVMVDHLSKLIILQLLGLQLLLLPNQDLLLVS